MTLLVWKLVSSLFGALGSAVSFGGALSSEEEIDSTFLGVSGGAKQKV